MAQKRIQLGVAKKIKNGARKIVLEKAEEARIAAFSACKSLGLNVPHFSRPLSLAAAQNATGQEVATTFSRDETSSRFAGLVEKEHLSVEASGNSRKVALEAAGEKLTKASEGGLAASNEVNSITALQHNSGAENPALPIQGSATVGLDLSLNINGIKTGTGTRTLDAHHDLEVQGRAKRDPCPVNKDSACKKGPTNAVNTPGGFDGFLDLWAAAQEFYFDIHYNKRSEMNSAAPFEIHGLAICWENSPVYYISLPKDLLWSNDKRKNNLLACGSSNENEIPPPEHWLEMMNQRWKRIGEIMQKTDVRKFTWNLKVQLQVLKCAAVSIQRFGFLNLVGKMDLKLIDSLYLLLSPVHMTDGTDLSIVTWILWPDEERSSSPNLEKVIHYLILIIGLNEKLRDTFTC